MPKDCFALAVSPAGYHPELHRGMYSIHSELFREGVGIPEAVAATHERSGTHGLRMLSAGSSYGVEADSVLAEHTKLSGERATMYGFDFDGLALTAAQIGRYSTLLRCMDDIKTITKMLEAYGFDYSVEGNDDVYRRIGIDSTKLRAKHDVSFTYADLSAEKLVLPKNIHLAMANNFLVYLSPEQAETAVRNLAGSLASTGILSIGVSEGVKDMNMDNHRSEISHMQWLDEAAGVLHDEFGLLPLDAGQDDYVLMFARS